MFANEEHRRRLFPVCGRKVFLAHAGVTALPGVVAEAMSAYVHQAACGPQEFEGVLRDYRRTRELGAELLGARWEEIALLGPTSLGLSLFANGITWNAGDEVVCYREDYPANVYPWMELERRGVRVRWLEPGAAGEITPELVKGALNGKTRLVALASCHFLSGYRPDLEEIGRILHGRGVLFSVDAIQTLGAFALDVERAHIAMLSADAHKWLLGPMAMGVVYVGESHFETVRPTLLGAWNVESPRFLTQEKVEFVPTARRYEPGVLNAAGVYGMKAAMELLLAVGIPRVSERILDLKRMLLSLLEPMGFQVLGPRSGGHASGITTVWHPGVSAGRLARALEEAGVVASLRSDRSGREYLRFSPHYYNTGEELELVARVLAPLCR
jgi:cysteine desulfurase/selenocysteine lyase